MIPAMFIGLLLLLLIGVLVFCVGLARVYEKNYSNGDGAELLIVGLIIVFVAFFLIEILTNSLGG